MSIQQVWHRWPGEPEEAYGAFQEFLASGWKTTPQGKQVRQARSLAFLRVSRGKQVVHRWRTEWRWDTRAAQYDSDLDRTADTSSAEAVASARVELAGSLGTLARTLTLEAQRTLAKSELNGRPLGLEKVALIAEKLARAAESLNPIRPTDSVVVNVHPDMSGLSDAELAAELQASEPRREYPPGPPPPPIGEAPEGSTEYLPTLVPVSPASPPDSPGGEPWE